MKLEHLAPYLPYGLKIKILNHKCDYVGIEFSEINGYYFLGDSLHVSYNGGYAGKSIDDFKPILRPLSDLNQDGEINTPESLQGCCYSYVQNLISQHYDVFGLIPQGLAIDVNTLKK